MKKIAKRFLLPTAGALLGAMAGFLYWKNVGCSSGTCLITSRPLNSTVYFAVLGALLFSMFSTTNRKTSG